jgi:hypothetical protein
LQQNIGQLQITKEDVSRELLKVESRLALIDADPAIVPPLEEIGILYESLRYKRYDMAWLLIKFFFLFFIKIFLYFYREFELKPNDLMAQITEESIRVDNELDDDVKKENESQQDEEKLPDWVFYNQSFIRDIRGSKL